MDLKSRIQKPRQAAQDNGLKILVYGASGVGKTTLCASTGDQPRTLILSAESGLLSIADADVDVLRIESMAGLREAYAMLRDGDHHYKWICLDSLSEIAEAVLVDEKGVTKDPRAAYGEMADVMIKMVKNFRDLPLNVVMVCKGAAKDDEGRMVWGPVLPGAKLAAELPFLFDELFCLVAAVKDGEVKRMLRTAADGKYAAKDRSGRLDQWEAPDLAAIYKKIHGPRIAAV